MKLVPKTWEILMSRLPYALAVGMLMLGASLAPAQDKVNKEDVSFKTTDGMLLKGTFYPGKGGSAPAVLMLHKMGGKRTEGDWEGLALQLQKLGYAVLTFDFRGHGGSTAIADQNLFWSLPHNQRLLRSYNPNKKTLSLTDMTAPYVPYLMNDIAAARHDLDNRNDNGQCNTSNLIIIGAEEGATLGFCWIVTEFYRPQVYQKVDLFQGGSAPLNTDPAGDDIAGAIWLSYKKYPGIKNSTISVPYRAWSVNNGPVQMIRDRVQMWFAAGAKDDRGMADAKYMYDTVLDAEKKSDKLELTSKKPIDGTNLRGIALVGQKSLPTSNLIEKFIEKAVKLRPSQSQKRRNASEFKPNWIEPRLFGFQ